MLVLRAQNKRSQFQESQSKTDSYSAIESEENKKKGEKQEKEKEEARSEVRSQNIET